MPSRSAASSCLRTLAGTPGQVGLTGHLRPSGALGQLQLAVGIDLSLKPGIERDARCASRFPRIVAAQHGVGAQAPRRPGSIQRRYELTAGNWTDQGHAVELLNVDLFFTRDGTFAKVLGDLTKLLPVRARVVLVDGREPVLNQLETAVG